MTDSCQRGIADAAGDGIRHRADGDDIFTNRVVADGLKAATVSAVSSGVNRRSVADDRAAAG